LRSSIYYVPESNLFEKRGFISDARFNPRSVMSNKIWPRTWPRPPNCLPFRRLFAKTEKER